MFKTSVKCIKMLKKCIKMLKKCQEILKNVKDIKKFLQVKPGFSTNLIILEHPRFQYHF